MTGDLHLRVLTVHQPWASCIAYGRKPWENRALDRNGRETPLVKFARKLEGQWVAIHSSNQAPRMDRFPKLAPDKLPWPHPTPWGVVVCTALIGRVLSPGDGSDRDLADPWRIASAYGIEFTRVRRFVKPVQLKGRQGWIRLASHGPLILEAIIAAHDQAAPGH